MPLPKVSELIEWLEQPEEELIKRYRLDHRDLTEPQTAAMMRQHRDLVRKIRNRWDDPDKQISPQEHATIAPRSPWGNPQSIIMQFSFDHWYMVPIPRKEDGTLDLPEEIANQILR